MSEILTPQIYVTYIMPAIIKPQIYTSYKINDTHVSSGNVDIFRAVKNMSNSNTDILRNISISSSGNADTMRDVHLGVPGSGNDDISRDVHFGVRGSGNADIRRTIKTSYSGNADMRYDARREQDENTDIMRNIAVRAAGNADISYLRRLLGVGNDDMIRIVKAISSGNADTRRIIPLIISDLTKAGIQSISITLAERTLSDTFQINTVNPLNVKDSIKGKLLDYSYSMSVESTSQQNMIQTVQGMYDVDELLYTPFHYFQPTENTAVAHARKIASAMGKSLSISIDDFIPSNNYAGTGATYQNIISGIFGWTSRLPRRQINVFIRNNVLNVIQRGHESSVVDISSYSHSQPQIERKIVRSVWSGNNGNSSAKNDETRRPWPFSGTIGDIYCYNSYSVGFLMASVSPKESTYYSYFGDYLEDKSTSRSDGSSVHTHYNYCPTENDMYITSEVETSTDKNGKSSTRITTHHPVGFGWYVSSTSVDGESQGSSLSQGKPGGKASQYCVDQWAISMGGKWPEPDDKIGGGTSLIDTDFPVKGTEMLKKLTAEIEWMNQRIEETVSVDITPAVIAGTCSLQHIIDFTDRIKLDGNEYYLVSNAVIQDPRSIKQKLKLVRWY